MAEQTYTLRSVSSDITSGFVVFLVALPLCLGICMASDAPLFAGILAGVIGGIIVGSISGSSTSVSGPAAGLIAVVGTQIQLLESFDAFLAAVFLAGIIQIIFGVSRMGFVSAFFPSSVIKGLLFAIGVILIYKQVPLVLGHDPDSLSNDIAVHPINTHSFPFFLENVLHIHPGTALIGLISLVLLVIWDKVKFFKNSHIPAPIVVIAFSIILAHLMQNAGIYWNLDHDHFVQVPIATTFDEALKLFHTPDFSALGDSPVYGAAITIAVIASLETLLNIEAVDRVDPLQRVSPPNRELVAQGIGNMTAGLLGALPITSVIVRSSVNIAMGAKTKLSTICHGAFILCSVLFVPDWLNTIPLSALAAVLLITGLKLANPLIVAQMWRQGTNQLLPFLLTVVTIVLTDLLIGVLVGLGVAICFILHSSIRSPIKMSLEKHASGEEVLHIELPNQVSFFNRAALEGALDSIPEGGHVLINASNTDYIDPDILDLITDFDTKNRGVENLSVSLLGFKNKHHSLDDRIQYPVVNNRDVQASLTPEDVLDILQEGNKRFRKGIHLTRILDKQLHDTSRGQYPMAVILSCIDSRTPAELVFDLGIGDIFSVRIAGNIVSPKVLGSMEYSCAVAGAKLILVMGHTSCGAVKATVEAVCQKQSASQTTGCEHLDSLIDEIRKSIDGKECHDSDCWTGGRKEEYCNEIAYKNVLRTIEEICKHSTTISQMINEGKIAIVGAMYDIKTAEVTFFQTPGCGPIPHIKAPETGFLRSLTDMKTLEKLLKPLIAP